MRSLLVFVLLLFAFPAQAKVTFDWVTIGDPGNAADDTGYGSVAYTYRISKYEVTNAQYAEFLNAVAATDTYGLYSANMGSGHGGITQSGTSGSYTYDAITGREDMPVNYVSFWDSIRFANWLHNGQPMGAQDNSTTENGAYTITQSGIDSNTITRNLGVATVFIPSENEWYKAAYYDTGAIIYYDYPAGSDTTTTCAAPGPTPNTANCSNAAGSDMTDVGSYTGAASPVGTSDQGGNVWEWNEAIISVSYRGHRGGAFYNMANTLAASLRGVDDPADESNVVGFRVAALGPGVPALGPVSLLLVAAGLLGFGAYRPARA